MAHLAYTASALLGFCQFDLRVFRCVSVTRPLSHPLKFRAHRARRAVPIRLATRPDIVDAVDRGR